ncbi:MAG: SPFH domain-containing protein [Myxococcales bacterium]|nr:SPFH domain-containing protein [Myxococcales bacterium]MCB9575941.1 SPFH domain-containing protein [Polyangiaceae bacterium]
MSTKLELSERATEATGWRQGRPVEDPAKTKSWGFVAAKPSEYLVHVRRGRVRPSSGQGATCFKWPWDAVAVVPTSFQRLSFSADQVTREKAGVEVVGLAVYRIAEPLVAYRVLNFSYPERAQEKLEQTLTAMFVGATRRLVANLTVEECLQKRKEALAEHLLREVAPVVGGEGRPEDVTDQGWGVVIDTIEIQEVRVQSAAVFDAMQAPYRAALERAAREARADAERDIQTREAECKKTVEETTIRAQLALEQERAELARRAEEIAARAAVERHARSREVARAELEVHDILARAQEQKLALERARLTGELEQRRAEAEVALLEGRARSEVQMALAKVEREQAEARAKLRTAERLPELAAAVGQRFGEVKVTHIGSDGQSPFGSIAQAVASVLELARQG